MKYKAILTDIFDAWNIAEVDTKEELMRKAAEHIQDLSSKGLLTHSYLDYYEIKEDGTETEIDPTV